MNLPSEDPIVRGIYGQMKEPINLLVERRYYLAAVALLFSAIDAVSNLGRPNDASFNTPLDFKQWAKKYLKIKNSPVEITPDDWWSTRNAILHTHSAFSKDTESGKAKYIIFAWGDAPVWHNPNVPDMLIVSLEAFRDAVFNGIDMFLIDIFTDVDDERRRILEDRLRQISVPMSKQELERKYKEGQSEASTV